MNLGGDYNEGGEIEIEENWFIIINNNNKSNNNYLVLMLINLYINLIKKSFYKS